MTRWFVFGAAALTIAACATAADTRKSGSALDRALAGRVAGAPVDCIDPSIVDGPQVIDDHTILYRSGRHLWRNTLEAKCPSLSPSATLIVEMRGSHLCRNDLFRVTEPGAVVLGRYCRLGKFVPYDRPVN